MHMSIPTFPANIIESIFSFRDATQAGGQPSGMKRFDGQEGIGGIALDDEDFNWSGPRQILNARRVGHTNQPSFRRRKRKNHPAREMFSLSGFISEYTKARELTRVILL